MNYRYFNKSLNVLWSWTRSIFIAVCLASLIRWISFEGFTIPTSSMEQTLLTGDYVFVSKLHYGTRTPRTLLQIPLTHQTCFGHQSYLDWVQLPSWRLPGFSCVKRGDIVVFNIPFEIDLSIDLRTYYVKRCVGVPGDILQIKDGDVYVKNLPDPLVYKGIQHRYYVQSSSDLSGLFSQLGIHEASTIRGGYLIHATDGTVDKLSDKPEVEQIRRFSLPVGMGSPEIYPDVKEWNMDQWGPVQVPARGWCMPVNTETLGVYGSIITKHEHLNEVEIVDDQLWIEGERAETYTFGQDYYFMMGDNRENSNDSRFWGFVPADHIAGKVSMVFFSLDPNARYWKKLRWNRLFRAV